MRENAVGKQSAIVPSEAQHDRGSSPQNRQVARSGYGITFYVVRGPSGRFLAVQVPSDDCQILATVTPPKSANDRLAA